MTCYVDYSPLMSSNLFSDGADGADGVFEWHFLNNWINLVFGVWKKVFFQ